MPSRMRVLVWGETLLALLLLASLLSISGASARALAEVVGALFGWPLLGIVALAGAQVYLSAVKWRHLLTRHAHHVRQSPRFYFFHTAYGMLLGQVVPVQLGTMASRGVALKLRNERRPFVTGAYTSVHEQLFDVLVPASMLPATLLASTHGWRPLEWCAGALAGIVGMGMAMAGMRALLGRHRRGRALLSRLLRRRRPLDVPEALLAMFAPSTLRYLCAASVLRYVVVLLRHALVAYACACAIDPWHVVMLAPAVQCIALLAITPGALGVVEWGWAGLLGGLMAYPLESAAVLALALRLSFVLSLVVLVLALRWLPQTGTREVDARES